MDTQHDKSVERDGQNLVRGLPTGPRAALCTLEVLDRYQDFAVVSNPPRVIQRLLFPIARRSG